MDTKNMYPSLISQPWGQMVHYRFVSSPVSTCTHVSTVGFAIYVRSSIVAPGAHSTAPGVSNATGGSGGCNRLMALCCSCLSFRAHLASICSCVFGALQMCLYDKFRSCEILPQFGHATRTFNASLGLVKSTIY